MHIDYLIGWMANTTTGSGLMAGPSQGTGRQGGDHRLTRTDEEAVVVANEEEVLQGKHSKGHACNVYITMDIPLCSNSPRTKATKIPGCKSDALYLTRE
jgi:hypothetical protein